MKTIDYGSRVKEYPHYQSWINSFGGFKDSIRENGVIDFEGLPENEQLCLYVYAWNKSGFLPGKKGIIKFFKWTNYKLQKIIKSLNGKIKTSPTFSEDTGLISGSGYELTTMEP
jgi:hypothetical protein